MSSTAPVARNAVDGLAVSTSDDARRYDRLGIIGRHPAIDPAASAAAPKKSSAAGMVTGQRKHLMPQIPIDLEALGCPPLDPNEPAWTAEEVRMSTPYSDVRTWRRILICQLRWGESRFQGPPGLLVKMTARLCSSKVTATRTLPSV